VKKTACVILFMVVVLFVGFAGGTKEKAPGAQKVLVTQWCFPFTGANDDAFFNPIIAAFEAQNPNVQVKIEYIPGKGRTQRIATAIAAGKAPDVAYDNDDRFSGYLDAIAPLDELLDKAVLDKRLAELQPGARSTVTYRGEHVWGLPLLMTSTPYFYNETMFNRAGVNPPATWDDLLNIAPKLVSGDQWLVSIPLLMEFPAFMFNPWLFQAGGTYFNEDGTKLVLNNGAGVEALTMLVKLYDSYINPADKGMTDTESFIQGRAAMQIGWENDFLFRVRKEAPDIAIRTGQVLKHKERGSHGTTAFYEVFKQSNHAEAAAKWVMFVTQDDNLLAFSKLTGFIPPTVPAASRLIDEVRTSDKDFAKAIEEVKYCYGIIHPKIQELWRFIMPEIQAAVLHEKSPKQALDDLVAQGDKLLP
jgi:multiple sugar transport system substrate-binding protein